MGFPEATCCNVQAPVRRGIRPSELAARARWNSGSLGPVELVRWLVGAGLAVLDDDGLLRPTPLVFELFWPGSFVEVVDG
jgi:hypothetical protein